MTAGSGTSPAAVEALVRWLRTDADGGLEPGLSSDELAAAQTTFGVTFPPTWADVLSRVLPIERPRPARPADGIRRWTRFPDWRGRDVPATRAMVERPVDGVLAEVGDGGFWWPAWGPRSDRAPDRTRVAAAALAAAPRLVPIRDHWYVGPDDDSPVFSIVGVDVWLVARRIADLARPPAAAAAVTAAMPFWSDLHEWSQSRN